MKHREFLDLLWEAVGKHKVIIDEGPEHLPSRCPSICVGKNEAVYSGFPDDESNVYIYEQNGIFTVELYESCFTSFYEIPSNKMTPEKLNNIFLDIWSTHEI